MTTLAAYLHALDPFAIRFWDGVGIRWYGLSYLVAFVIGYFMIKRVARAGGSTLKPEGVSDFLLALMIGAVAGGRLGYVLLYDPSLWGLIDGPPYWGVLAIQKGGMASHGGMVGVILACLWFARRRGHSWPHLLDLAAFGTPIGLLCGRLANFVNGELYGRPCAASFPLAVKFPQEISQWKETQLKQLEPLLEYLPAIPGRTDHLIDGSRIEQILNAVRSGQQEVQEVIAHLEPLLTPRHPSQLYQAALEGLVLMTVLLVAWRKPRKPLVLGGIFATAYGILRIAGEFYRQPDAAIGYQLLGSTRGQLLSLILLVSGVIMIRAASRRDVPAMGGWLPTR